MIWCVKKPNRLILGMTTPIEYQARSGNGSLHFFATFKEAYDCRPWVWKISYRDDAGKNHRWVKYLRCENDPNLMETFSNYRDCLDPNQIFWVDEPLHSCPPLESFWTDEMNNEFESELIHGNEIKLNEWMIKRKQAYHEWHEARETWRRDMESGKIPALECLTDMEFRARIDTGQK